MAKTAGKASKRGPAAKKPARKRHRAKSGGPGRISTWLQSIWRHRWLSLATAWIICVLGWTAIALWPNVYMSSAVIYVDIEGIAKQSGSADETSSRSSENQRPVARLKDLLLSDVSLSTMGEAVGLDEERSRSMRDDIMLRPTAPSVFVAAYDHSEPIVAQQVLQQLFSSFQTRIDADAASSERETLERAIDEQKRKIDSAAAAIEKFERVNRDHLGQTEEQSAGLALLKQEILSLQDRINSAIIERDQFAEKLAQNAQGRADSGEVPSDSVPANRQAELDTLQAKLGQLKERYAESHPYVLAVIDAIDDLKARGEAASREADPPGDLDPETAELKSQHETHIARLSQLNDELATKHREIDRLEALTETTSSVDAELSKLRGDLANLENALESMIARRDELGKKQESHVEQASFRLIKEPNLPAKPTGPSRLVCLALVLLGGLGIGGVVAVLRNHAKGVFENAWQLKQRFDVGVLGTISEVLTPAERKRIGYSRLAFGLGSLALVGVFSGLALAELNNLLAPWGDLVRGQLLR